MHPLILYPTARYTFPHHGEYCAYAFGEKVEGADWAMKHGVIHTYRIKATGIGVVLGMN